MTGDKFLAKKSLNFADDPTNYDYGGLYRNNQITSGGASTDCWLYSYNRIKIAGSEVLINGNTPITSGNISSQSVSYATSAGSVSSITKAQVTAALGYTPPTTNSTYNFSGVSFTSGQSSTAEHNCNNITSNGVWYYTSNGPATSLGASTTDGALYSQAYSTSWVGQIAQDYRNGRLFVRGKNNNSWQSWLRVALYSEIPSTISWSNVTSKVTSKGSATQPVYINSSGDPVACTAYSSASVNYANSAGSATDSSKLPLAGGAMSSGARISFSSGNGYIGNSGNQGWVGFQDISSQDSLGDSKWSLRTNGTAHFVSAYASSDRRKKKNIKQISESEYLEYFKTIDGFFKSFIWKESGNKSFGAIAQEVEGWCPECVDHNDDGYLSINYNALLSKACAALFLKVKELEKELEELRRS